MYHLVNIPIPLRMKWFILINISKYYSCHLLIDAYIYHESLNTYNNSIINI